MSGQQIGFGDFPGFEEFAEKESNDYIWRLSDLNSIARNSIKVFSCFAGGGGSTMGYKLAGCDVLGCCEIDSRMNEIYVKNHKPKYNFLMDIRVFNDLPDEKLPRELFELDILDGSPPCSVFTLTRGERREDSWNRKKKFREGQVEQILDELPFVFIQTVKRLRPKVVCMENVEGLILGGAWKYVQRIYKDFQAAGYSVRHFLARGERMGIPQARHRVFFIAVRNDIPYDLHGLNMGFHYKPILYREIKTGTGAAINPNSKTYQLLQRIKYGETDLSDAHLREYGKGSMFNSKILYDDRVCPTITANGLDCFRYGENTRITIPDIIKASTFPEDFDFIHHSITNICYVCGMSVPPIMTKRIAERLITSIFNKESKPT